MNFPRYSQLAARFIDRARSSPTREGTADRERGLATIRAAFVVSRRRSALRRRVAMTMLCAAVAAAAVIVSRMQLGVDRHVEPIGIAAFPRGAGAAIEQEGASSMLGTGTTLSPGARLRTGPTGGAELQLTTGSNLLLHESAALAVRSYGEVQRFELGAGSVDVHVAKLSSGSRFLLDTPDAQVEVHGTKFRVDVLETPEPCPVSSRTRVSVTEGVVEVRARGFVARLLAGQEWPGGCDAIGNTAREVAPSLESDPGDRVALPVKSAGSRAEKPFAAGAERPPQEASSVQPNAPSVLGESNELFRAAASAARAGDVNGALAGYERFLNSYPDSALAENALVARMRLFGTSNQVAARREAERYLARYPRGFARAEAKRTAER